MLLDPGPIPVIPEATSDPTVDPQSFSDLVNQELGTLPQLEASMDALIDPTIPTDLVPPDDQLDATLDGLTNDLQLATVIPGVGLGTPADLMTADFAAADTFDATPDTGHIDALVSSRADQMVNVYDVTPGEAFYPVPDSLGLFDPNAPTPGSTTVGTKIENLTRPGATDFFPGEQYKITVTVGPVPGGGSVIQGVEIVGYPWQNDTPVQNIDFGSTDINGVLCVAGIWGYDGVGDWGMTIYQTWPSGQILAGNTIYWTVSPLPPGQAIAQAALNLPVHVGFTPTQCQGNPPPASNVTVTLVNLTTPGASVYAVGDSWLLTVTGQASQQVEISALQNGNPLNWEILGLTDTTGTFTLQGTMPDDTYVGDWQEFYQVGSVRWAGSLSFTVTP